MPTAVTRLSKKSSINLNKKGKEDMQKTLGLLTGVSGEGGREEEPGLKAPSLPEIS